MSNILVFSAHPDDEILGCAGTVAKYVKEGKNVVSVIFCYGELSHPWMKKHIIKDVRIKESKKASELIGSKAIFFGLDEKDAQDELKDEKTRHKIKEIIQKYRPEKIFTHSSDDPHPLHQAVHRAIVQVCDKIKQKNIYVFDIWNPLNITKRKLPRLYVDISETFRTKIIALKVFQSQKIQMQLPLLWSIYAKAIKAGFENGTRFAEVFYKTR